MSETIGEVKRPQEQTAFDLWLGEPVADMIADQIRRLGRPLLHLGERELSLMEHWYPELTTQLNKQDQDAA